MHQDVIELRRFYYGRALGRIAQGILRERLQTAWPPAQMSGMTIAGMGFAVPLLRPWLGQARRVIGLMPDGQGVMGWPARAPNHSVLCAEAEWPLETGSLDRLVLLHALETSDDPKAVLAEAWRVLGPGGRLMVMVPNRAGLWARSDSTPFGVGRSYSRSQLERQLESAGFVAERGEAAIYIPPSDRRFWLRTAIWWERLGRRIAGVLVAGVIMAEFSKQVSAPILPARRAAVPSPLDVLGGIARPAPGPARPAHNDTASQEAKGQTRTGPGGI
ncbi:MAG: methyltransferase domain-containing protein [Paracoccus sp. (in: a-proteobacteria)]|nr:methyltransferase domain-containing protein [Paracoccus sp. (in: a-proteobacteria)]